MYLSDDPGQVDPIQVELEIAREHLGGHGLAGAAGPGEQRGDPAAAPESPAEAPALVHLGAIRHLSRDLAELPEQVVGDHDVVPARDRRQPLRHVVQAAGRLVAPGRPEVGVPHSFRAGAAEGGAGARRAHGPDDRCRPEVELLRERLGHSPRRDTRRCQSAVPHRNLRLRIRRRYGGRQETVRREPALASDNHEWPEPIDDVVEAECGGLVVGVRRLGHVEGEPEQRRLALQDRQRLLPRRPGRRHSRGVHCHEPEPELPGELAGDGAPPTGGWPDEVHPRPSCGSAFECPTQSSGQLGVCGRERRRLHWAHERGDRLVEVVRAARVLQEARRQAQGPSPERVAGMLRRS